MQWKHELQLSTLNFIYILIYYITILYYIILYYILRLFDYLFTIYLKVRWIENLFFLPLFPSFFLSFFLSFFYNLSWLLIIHYFLLVFDLPILSFFNLVIVKLVWKITNWLLLLLQLRKGLFRFILDTIVLFCPYNFKIFPFNIIHIKNVDSKDEHSLLKKFSNVNHWKP